jgi:hypothetical protein
VSRPRVPVTATLALVCCVLVPATLQAQTKPTPAQTKPTEDSSGGRKSGTYLKLGLAHWQGDIFSESSLTSLTRWSADLFGADYALTSVNLEVDTYLAWASFPISGFAIAYRKDAIPSVEAGHMFSGTGFHDFDLKVVAVKVGGGFEWGMPSLNFDRTQFAVAADGTVRYRHTYPYRNSTVPVGSRRNGTFYPFVALSLVQRPGPLLLEFGMRVNVIRFHFDDYEVQPGGQVMRAFDERQIKVPYLFANFGLRLF